MFSPTAYADACANKNKFEKINFGIVGDSFFTTDIHKLGSLNNKIKMHFPKAFVQNSALAGAKVLSYSKSSVKNQNLKKPIDILIIGGGGNDFQTCKQNQKCLESKMDGLISPDLDSGAIVEIIRKFTTKETVVFIMYTSEVSKFAPKQWQRLISSGIGNSYAERMSSFAELRDNVFWVDAADTLDTASRVHWLKDGYHPSSAAYDLLVDRLASHLC